MTNDSRELSDEESQITSRAEMSRGNWGNKLGADARWLKQWKIVKWGPQRSEWDVSAQPHISTD